MGDVSIKDCRGFVQRTIKAGSETYLENIYTDEPSCEIVFRKLVNSAGLENSAETDIERVIALRSHPLQIEFHQRNKADGFRVQWDMPKSALLSVVEAFVREANILEKAKPTTVGYGVTSDPVQGCSYDSLFAAVEIIIKEPWQAIEVEKSGCTIEDCDGYTLRKMRLKATGEVVTERITINEEIGCVTYNKCDASGAPGDVERVLAIHTPLRLELYERSARSNMRVDWKAPYDVARDTFSNIVQLAKKMEATSSDMVGYGLASEPITGASEDAAWKAMLHSMRNALGLPVDNVTCRDMDGFVRRTMRFKDEPGTPIVADNLRIIESAKEITCRAVIDDVEGEQERVFALRTDPLRFEAFKRNAKDKMRLDWQAPRSACTGIFAETAKAAQCM